MRFISNGDYILPLEFPSYWAQHVYTWSFERGAANPDGIMRLPGRFVDILVFGLFGNLGVSYFYLLSCLVIAFLCFLWFSRSFLGAARWGAAVLGSLFFALNPIFLGNVSKIGLILAVSMLPLALVALKQGFATRRFSYFLLFILALNVSLLHPFTFAVNALASIGYLVHLARKHWPFFSDNRWKFALLGVVALLLNAYAILPLASMRTLDKGALSDQVSSTPTDYTSLVDVANTGDIFTGLSLSKGVLKDYEFFGPTTWPFYFLGVFLFYILLFSVYVRVEKRTSPHERRRFLLAIGIFLGLLVLATASYLYADVLIKFLISLPGGWMFRSPLKWQLYMPLVLFAALVIALKYVHDGWRLKLLYAAFGLSFILMNGYLFTQVYERLLKPRSVTYFSALAGADIRGKNLLVADSSTCTTIAQNYPTIATELNQVLISKSAQVKHAQASKLHTVNLAQYDYVLGCAGTLDQQLLTKQFDFARSHDFLQGAYELYTNTKPVGLVSAAPGIFALERSENLGAKYALATQTLQRPFIFATDGSAPQATGLQDIFDGFSAANISQGSLQTEVTLLKPERQLLYSTSNQPMFAAQTGDAINITTTASNDAERLGQNPIGLKTAGESIRVTYSDPRFSYENLMPNPSFEERLWQEQVGDCNNYDGNPSIGMKHVGDASDGQKSLQLSSKAHIACTQAEPVAVTAGQKYLLSFNYKTNGKRSAGYYAEFDDMAKSSTNARLDSTDNDWQIFTKVLTIPNDTQHLKLLLYAYPSAEPGKAGVAHYDNVKLIHVPDVFGQFFLVGDTDSSTQSSAPRIDYEMSNPTRTEVQVRGAQKPFYLSSKETYHNLWQLKAADGQILPGHMRLNNLMNGWYVEPDLVCAAANCTKNADGSYDFTLTITFAPQSSFYKGLLISGITLVGVLGYVGYDLWRAKRQGGFKR